MFDYIEYCKKKLCEQFSELEKIEKYKDVFRYAFMPPQDVHGIYEGALCDYILDLIQQGYGRNKIKIDQAFDLIEELIQHENFDVYCVAKVSFIEPFLDKIKPTKEVERYLRPYSLKAAQEIGKQWFGLNPITWELDR